MTLTPQMKTWYGQIATVGTIGRFSKMPGTLGSIAGSVLWLISGGLPLWAIAAAAVVGCVAADRYERAVRLENPDREDPGDCVIDEVVGVWIASWGFDLSYAVVALFLFRIIDITKPFPVSFFDRLPQHFKGVPGGVGIMADDIVGGIIVNLLLRFIHWLLFAGGVSVILSMVGR